MKKEQSLNALLDCYESLFKSILDRGYKKVILASLGTGVHGYKHNNISKPLVILLNNFCKNNNVDIYLININTLYTNIYLEEYITLKGIDLKKELEISYSFLKEIDLSNITITNMWEFLDDLNSKYGNSYILKQL